MMQHIKISYWKDPNGEDFTEIDEFRNALSTDFVEINAETADGYGSGFYELAIEVINDVNLKDFLVNTVYNTIDYGLGLVTLPILKAAKKLFSKNSKLDPGIEYIKVVFKDVDLHFYSIYNGSIEKNMNDIIKSLETHYLQLQNLTQVKSIHIPIFDHVDTYKICRYRVKLDVDENIHNFSKNDYFNFWGIRDVNQESFVYKLDMKRVVRSKFYTQEEYNLLLEEEFKKQRECY